MTTETKVNLSVSKDYNQHDDFPSFDGLRMTGRLTTRSNRIPIKLTTISLIIFVAAMITKDLNRKVSILKEAARLFRVMGFTATSMRDLAEAVGMEAASLYNHINSKQELLEIICMTIADGHLNGLSEVEKKEKSPLNRIEGLIRRHIKIITDQPEMAAVAHDQWRHLDEMARNEFVKKRKRYEQVLNDWIEEAKALNQIKNYDTHVMLYTLLSSLQWLHHWFRSERPIEQREIEEEMVGLILNGLKK